MWIENTLRYPGGGKHLIGTLEYHFTPQTPFDDRDLAWVEEETHISVFLSILEGFRPSVTPVPFRVNRFKPSDYRGRT